MAVHPAPGSRTGTLVQWLWEHYRTNGFEWRHVAPVSRLDRGTSGLCLLATDAAVHPNLHRQVLARQIRREYHCLIWGQPLFQETVVSAPLGRHWEDTRRMAVYDLLDRDLAVREARPAVTRLRVIERFPGFALLSASLETGRMHQIRAHCQFIRLPVVGDNIYRGGRGTGREAAPLLPNTLNEAISALHWQCLHAGRLEFRHPLTGEMLQFQDPIPPPFAAILDQLRSLNN